MGRLKKFAVIIFIVGFSLLFSFNVSAEEGGEFLENHSPADYADELLAENDVYELFDSLPDNVKELFSSLGIDEITYEAVVSIDIKTVFSSVYEFFSGKAASPLKYSAVIFGIISLTSIVTGIEGGKLGKSGGLFDIAEVLFIGTAVILPLSEALSAACSVIKTSNVFMLSLIPVLTAFVAVSGNPTAALSCNALIFGAAEVISRLSQTLISSFIRLFFSLNIVAAISTELNLGALCSFVKKTVVVVLGFAATIFSGLLTVKGVLSGAADSALMKGAKFISGSFIPVIGGALGDAIASLAGSLSLAKNTVGAFGIIAVSVISLPGIIELTVWIFCLNLLSAAADILGRPASARFLTGISSAASLLNITLILNCAVLIISIGIMVLMRNSL